MSSIKMADAFGKLAGICAGLEGRYTPAHPNLLPSSLAAQLTGAYAAVESVVVAERVLRRAVKAREQDFRETAALATRIRELLRSHPDLAGTLADSDVALKKLSGSYRVKGNVPSGEGQADANRKRTARGMDYLNRIGHLDHVVKSLQQEPAYRATAADLSVASLATRLENLRETQQGVTDAEAGLQAARRGLKAVFYDPVSGLVATGIAVRRNIRAQFGLSSTEAMMLRGIRFRMRT